MLIPYFSLAAARDPKTDRLPNEAANAMDVSKLIDDKDELLKTAKLLKSVKFSAKRGRLMLTQVTDSVLRKFNAELSDVHGTSLVSEESPWSTNLGLARHVAESWQGWLSQPLPSLQEAFNAAMGDLERLEKQLTGWSLAFDAYGAGDGEEEKPWHAALTRTAVLREEAGSSKESDEEANKTTAAATNTTAATAAAKGETAAEGTATAATTGTWIGPMICAFCGTHGTEGTKLLCCSRCKLAHYCSRECQKQHWKGHKKVCAPPPTPPPEGFELAALSEPELRSYIDAKGLSHEDCVTVTELQQRAEEAERFTATQARCAASQQQQQQQKGPPVEKASWGSDSDLVGLVVDIQDKRLQKLYGPGWPAVAEEMTKMPLPPGATRQELKGVISMMVVEAIE